MDGPILVTGATGQLGGALVAALRAEGREVRCLVRQPGDAGALRVLGASVVQGDVTEPESLGPALAGVRAVFHLAGAISYEEADRAWLERVNLAGTRHVLAAAAAAGVSRLVLTSSIATLGWVEGDSLGDEQTAFNWGAESNPYFDTKRAAEALALAEERLEVCAVNPGVVLGAGDVNRNGARMLEQLAAGQVPGVPVGATTLANLEDVVQGHLVALERGRPGERYVLGGTELSFAELFTRLAAVVGVSPPGRRLSPWLLHGAARVQALAHALGGPPPRLTPALVRITARNRRYSSDKARAELGYAPGPLERGAEACWSWLQEQETR